MKKQKIINKLKLTIGFTLFILLFYSCKSINNSKDVEDFINYEEVLIEGFALPSAPFNFFVNKKNLTTKFGKSVKESFEVVNNRWDSNKIDTVFYYTLCNNNLHVYSKVSESIILYANIQDDCIVLRNGIKVGLDKNEVFSIIPQLTKTTSNKISISDESGLSSIYLLFENNKLKNIFIIADIEY